MHRLTCIRERERGAIAAIVAMLFGFGVILSLAALTVDVGNINADRRQLQNGADAVALAVAQKCVAAGTCSPGDANLQTLVNANAADRKTSLRRVDGQTPAICGNETDVHGKATGLSACPTSPGPDIKNLQECPSPPASGLNYVRVYTETENSDGKNLLPYYFGAAITGISDANQQACATVAWGPAGVPPNPFPITFSDCDWKAATGSNPSATPPVLGTYVAPPQGPSPGYGPAGNGAGNTTWPAVGSEVTLYTAKASTPKCTSWNGHVAPGNFGALDNVSCSAVIIDGWVKGDPGNDDPCKTVSTPPNRLKDKLGHIINIPIFDCFTKVKGSADCANGANHDWFHITGYAPFYLTGYYLAGTGSDGASIYPPDNNAIPCNGSDRCVSGWFTTSTLKDTPIDPSGAPNMGATAIQLNG